MSAAARPLGQTRDPAQADAVPNCSGQVSKPFLLCQMPADDHGVSILASWVEAATWLASILCRCACYDVDDKQSV